MNTIQTPRDYSTKQKNTSFKRLLKEISSISSCSIYRNTISQTSSAEAKNLGILIVPSTKNLTTFVGYIRGPPDSCYSNAVYELSILVGSKYPFEAPKVSFNRSSIPYHPNVSSVTGYICCTVLSQWQPNTSLKDVMLGLQFLLACPNWEDPQDKQVQIMYKQDPEKFDKKARLWAANRAHPSDTIEWLIESVPPAPEKQIDTNGTGVGPMAVEQLHRDASSSTTLPVMGSFRMSTKKDGGMTERQEGRFCASICPVQ